MTIILAIVGLVIGAGAGYFASSSSLQPKIDDLENQVSSLNSEVSTLRARKFSVSYAHALQ
jgi:outer membrane murein-binding lipoprotein Lpp